MGYKWRLGIIMGSADRSDGVTGMKELWEADSEGEMGSCYSFPPLRCTIRSTNENHFTYLSKLIHVPSQTILYTNLDYPA